MPQLEGIVGGQSARAGEGAGAFDAPGRVVRRAESAHPAVGDERPERLDLLFEGNRAVFDVPPEHIDDVHAETGHR